MADTYTVLSQVPVTDSQPGVGIVPAMEITFKAHPSEQVAKVRVPSSQYHKEHVDQVLREHAERLNEIQAL